MITLYEEDFMKRTGDGGRVISQARRVEAGKSKSKRSPQRYLGSYKLMVRRT